MLQRDEHRHNGSTKVRVATTCHLGFDLTRECAWRMPMIMNEGWCACVPEINPIRSPLLWQLHVIIAACLQRSDIIIIF